MRLDTGLDALIEALRCLPGVGLKSAQRMAFHLLQNDRSGAMRLSAVLADAVQAISHCRRCHTFTQGELCSVCQDSSRDGSLLCVVETPADQAALERTGTYRGSYFVLMGRLNPLQGLGADAIGLRELLARASEDQSLREVILATSFTAEGEATAQALAQALGQLRPACGDEPALKVTRLAKGVPAGSELEFVDLSTIAHALALRR